MDKFKQNYFENPMLNIEEIDVDNLNFYIEDAEFNEYRKNQSALLEKLMKEENLISHDFLNSEFMYNMKQAREMNFGSDLLKLDEDRN